MFDFIWRRFIKWQSHKTLIKRSPKRTCLCVEMLEGRLTPSASASITNTTLTITTTTGDSFTVVNAGGATFQQFTITDTTTTTFYTTPSAITAMVFNLGNGANSLAFNGTAALPIDLTGPTTAKASLGQWLQTTKGPDLAINGTGGDKTITASDLFLFQSTAGLNMKLTGNGTLDTTFTDSNITGSATISHPGTGDTTFTLGVSANNVEAANNEAVNTWGSLSITNGAGADTNAITDTNFTGSVIIANGAGHAGMTGLDGGSQNNFSEDANGYNTNLLTIGGNLTITTTTLNSDTEVQDYNVHGNVTLGAGAGVANQESIVGLEDNQTIAGSALPYIGGSVMVTGNPVVNSTLTVAIGIDTTGNNDFPLIVGNGVNANITGAGSPTVTLNDLTVNGSSDISLGATTIDDTVTVQETNGVPTSYGPLTIAALGSVKGTNDVELQSQGPTAPGTLNVTGALTVNLGAGTDDVNLGSTDPSNVVVTGAFVVNATVAGSNAITITSQGNTFGGLNWTLSGKGTEDTTFTDTNMTGTGTINTSKLTGALGTTGAGASPTTTFTINASANNNLYAANAGIDPLNTWGNLSIINGAGSDINSITDTDFTGNVSIANGAGATGDTDALNGVGWGGSQTTFSDNLNNNLLNIQGNLSITTTTGASASRVRDYNVHGNVTLGAGAGFSNQDWDSLVGLENTQTVAGSGIPVIGGNVTITGNAVPGASGNPLSPGLDIFLGTNQFGAGNLPLIIGGSLTITTGGTGEADIYLRDLSVATGTTTITLGKTNSNDAVQVQADPAYTSVYDNFTFNSSGSGANTLSLQDGAGNLEITGALDISSKLSTGANVVNFGADSGNPTGVASAIIDLYGLNTFTFGSVASTVFEGTPGTNLFYINTPTYTF